MPLLAAAGLGDPLNNPIVGWSLPIFRRSEAVVT